MFQRWKKMALPQLAGVSLLGLLITGCSQSKGTGYGATGVRSESRPIVKPAASPDSGMTYMNVPQKPAGAKKMAMNSTNQVVIQNFSFVPATLTVKAGTTVTWVNRDDEPHTATDTDKRFNSKTLDTDEQFSFSFSEPGTYNYYCALHPKMTGQIIVK